MISLKKIRSVCYESKCKTVKNKVVLSIVINDQEIVCPEKGGILSVDNFEGFIECPNTKDVCVGNLLPEAGGKQGFQFFEGLVQKLLNVVLEFIDWLYKRELIAPTPEELEKRYLEHDAF